MKKYTFLRKKRNFIYNVAQFFFTLPNYRQLHAHEPSEIHFFQRNTEKILQYVTNWYIQWCCTLKRVSYNIYELGIIGITRWTVRPSSVLYCRTIDRNLIRWKFRRYIAKHPLTDLFEFNIPIKCGLFEISIYILFVDV